LTRNKTAGTFSLASQKAGDKTNNQVTVYKEIIKMPRRTDDDLKDLDLHIEDNDIDIEDMYRIESDEEKNSFESLYTKNGFHDRYSPSDYDYDVDNYGYADSYYDR
jgi:hypothetical protein